MRLERIEWDGAEADALAAGVRALVPRTEDVASEAVARSSPASRRQGDTALRELAIAFGETPPERLRVDPERIRSAAGLRRRGVARQPAHGGREHLRGRPRRARAPASGPRRPSSRRASGSRSISAPVASAGVYAPGGRGVYPSSVLMCCLPALAAGVSRIVVVTPPGGEGRPSDVVLAACAHLPRRGGLRGRGRSGDRRARLRHRHDRPGRRGRRAGQPLRDRGQARRLGLVGIDGIAGPSELVIVADGTAPPQAIALDLCAQAEHGDDTPPGADLAQRRPARRRRRAGRRPWPPSVRRSPTRRWR